MIPQKESLELFCSQCDTSLRRFTFALYNGNTQVLIPSSATVLFQQSNGATHACSIENGLAVLNAYADMTAIPGRYRCNLKITEQDGGVIHSAVFTLNVEEAVYHD